MRIRNGSIAARAFVLAVLLLGWSKVASADDVVELANGGRIRGTITEFVVNDHVSIALVDGTTITVAWADVARVGSDADAIAPIAPAPIPVVTTAAADTANDRPPFLRPAPAEDPWLRYRSLPRRGRSVVLFLGGLFGSLEGLSLIANGIDSGGFEKPGAAILGGVVVVGAGSVMMAFGFRRLKARRRGIEQLRSEGYVIADAGDPMSLGVDVARGRFVPRLTLRF